SKSATKEPEAKAAIKVLIVDDIPETRDHLTKLLSFEQEVDVCGTADSGEEAIKAAMDLRPDVIVMDINMPGMDGVAASEIISQRLPTTPIIMMSVHGEAESLRRAMLAGARVFLVDANLQFGDIGVLLNLNPKNRSIIDAVERGEPDGDVIDSVVVDHSTGIRVLLAPPSPEGADLVTPPYLRKIVDHLR